MRIKNIYNMTKPKKLTYFLFLLLVFTFGFLFQFEGITVAEDTAWIELDGNKLNPAVPVELRDRTLQLNLKTTGISYVDTSKYRVTWDVLSQDGQNIISVVGAAGNQTIGLVTALSPGVATVTVTIEDATSSNLGILDTATCKINVVFAMDTSTDNTKYKYIYDSSTYRSLILYSNETIDLNLNFGLSTDAQWISANEEIVEVGQRTGGVTAKGTGKTTITTTYTPEGSSVTYSADLDVYVIPRVTDKASENLNKVYHKSLSPCGLENKSYIYTDALFGSNNTEPIQNKLIWVIKKDNALGVPEVIADSLGNKTSSLISLNPLSSKSNTFEVNAKAGMYDVYFYAVGTYVNENNYSKSYQPTYIQLTVFANFENYREVLQIGDAYSIAEAFNLTLDDFKSMFQTPILTYNGQDASNYATYNQTTGVITTKKKGDINVNVKATLAAVEKVKSLFNTRNGTITPFTEFDITLSIIDYFYLDRNAETISVGQTLQLIPITSNEMKSITWTSSDTKYVTVDPNTGLIRGIKETTDLKNDIVITATMDAGNGLYPQAYCYIKVEQTVTDVTLDPAELTLKVGESYTIVAKMKQNVTTAPLIWQSLDTSIFTISVASDNKSAVITAKKGGEAYLTLTNSTTSANMANAKIKVLVLMESITFPQGNIEDHLFREGRQINYTIKPANANANDLVWVSSDVKIATVDSKGYVTYKAPGVTLITAYSKSNVLASSSFYLTVKQSASSAEINPKTLTLESGQTSQMECILKPAGSTNPVTWTSSNTSIATVTSTGLVTARAAGTTQIWASAEGLNAPVVSQVTVTQKSTGISFSLKELTLETGETYSAPATVIKPSDSTDTLTWLSLDPKVVKIETDGKLTAVAAGSTFIQVKTSSGADAMLTVHVRDRVKGLALDKSTAEVTVGSTVVITPVFTPKEPYNQAVSYTTSNASIATVRPDGKTAVVTGMKGGLAVITATSTEGGYKAICLVTVKEKSTGVTIDRSSYKLPLGKSIYLNAKVTSDTATNSKITWSTGNKKIAKVNQSGKVTGKKIGTTTIRAKATDGSGAFATCKIQVVRRVKSLSLNRKKATLLQGATLSLKARVKPMNATIKKVLWASSNNNVATVDSSGIVHALQPGLVRIKATTNDGGNKSAVCLITVREKVESTGITSSVTDIILVKGSSVNAGFNMEPKNSTDVMRYRSDNKAVATVDSQGKITGIRTGNATIYGTTTAGHTAYIEVLVVGMNRTSTSLRQYDTETLWVNGISTNIQWYSANPQIATIVNGKLVARKVGSTSVYAVVKGTRITCRVTVTKIR